VGGFLQRRAVPHRHVCLTRQLPRSPRTVDGRDVLVSFLAGRAAPPSLPHGFSLSVYLCAVTSTL
jgi:hypothetical protein